MVVVIVDGCKSGVGVVRAKRQLEKFVGDGSECQKGVIMLLLLKLWIFWLVIFIVATIASSATA
jgi:hypothetical protein